MRVYWLGEEFDPGTGAAPLDLLTAGMPDSAPGYRATLSYEESGGDRGRPMISFQEFPIEAWESLNPDGGGHHWNSPGAVREEIVLADGRAVLIKVLGRYARYIAHVYFEDTVVLVSDHDEETAYTNRETFIAVIEGLRPYE
jgi:hypothetical protein